MRITHQMLSRNYINRMNTNLSNLTRSNEKMASQRAFNKSYENVSDAGKALKIRKLITDNERYQDNVRDAQGRAAAAEDAILTVNSLTARAKDLVTQGLNGTYDQTEKDMIATELEKLQEEIFQVMNTQFSDKYVFTAAGNKDGAAPFSKDAGGNLLYQGQLVDSMVKDPLTGNPTLGGNPIQWNDKNYINIGFGYKIGADGKVDPNTAFQDTYSGVGSFGFGVNADGVPLNAYSLFGDMAANLRSNDMVTLGKDLDAIGTTMDFLLTSVTEIGARVTTLNDTMASLEKEYINLAETQNNLEGIDLAEEMIYNKDHDMSWMVTLQLGSRILPQTIFDFMR